MSNTLDYLFTSDRLVKDVETLMNSLFWVEALKAQNAKGISDSLKYQLSESEQFMKNFIEYTLNLKRRQFQNQLVKQTNEQKRQIHEERQTNLENIIQNTFIGKTEKELLEFYLNNKYNKSNQELNILLPNQFLLECMFLAILDFNDYIATSGEIQTKLIDWFPEMRISNTNIKSLIESILNTNLCFKRLNNFTKASNQKHKPIILGKRQYVWSINQNFLKPFIRYFYKMYEKKTGYLINLDESFSFEITSSSPSLVSIPLNQLKLNELDKLNNRKKFNLNNDLVNLNEFNSLFYSWKQKLEQFKLLMQIKHNSFGYSSSSDTISLQTSTSQLDFTKYHKSNQESKKVKSRHKLKRLNEPVLKPNYKEVKTTRPQLSTEFIQQDPIYEVNPTVHEPVNHDYSSYLEHNTNFDNLITNEDLNKLDESKVINPMIADSLVNTTHLMPNLSNSYFNILPVSPTICHSFFSHNEINVSHMLDANNDELFCDTLNPDISIQI